MARMKGDPATLAWVDDNPLRAWRQSERYGLMDVAAHLQVSVTTIQLWEKGVTIPSPDHVDAIGDLIQRSDLAQAWADWYNRKPKIGATA